METEYMVKHIDGSQDRYINRIDIAIEYGLPKCDFEFLKKELANHFGDTLIRNNKLELVDEREQAIYKRICNIKRPRPKGEFKVGDKVRIIKNNGSEYYNQFMGKIVDVIKVDSRGASIYVNMPSEDGNGNPICSQDELELVEAAK